VCQPAYYIDGNLTLEAYQIEARVFVL